MRIIFLNLLIILVLNAQSAYSQKPNNSCTITYIANEGFLIETANHKILIDALFGNIRGNWNDQPSDSISNLMLKGLPPFDNVDLILVTHKHSDHFNPPMIINFLKNNQKSILICPDQANQLLKSDADYLKVSKRLRPILSSIPFDTSLSVNNIKIKILRLNHGSYFEKDSITGENYDLHSKIENFAYLIEVDSFIIYHSGDGSPATNIDLYKNYSIGDNELDIAFLDRVYLSKEGQELINKYINSNNIIFMHIDPGKSNYYKSVIQGVPEMFVFQASMEKRVISSNFLYPSNFSFKNRMWLMG
ncbi:MAG: hypothetical protein A2W99_10810 [Bacteroidetes bacterium GWF2_33_16]|nr:MAG: hypothetical protein A2X00_04930 [Bacteroidetes bacterium GWE2_32_14]OFY04029.1 MAG: hypothetical protein A2W99_10810 [Bacteroidetes bacterium GWF2_33_16]